MTDRVGQQFGNYRLTHLLGSGGFAEVYLAEHKQLGMKAAIKILHAHLASAEISAFRQKARIIADLKHPHIIRIYDFDVQNGTPFLVLDYASKGSLRALHPKGTGLPLHLVVNYVEQIASALQHAHEHKLIHRDVKPENVLIGEDGHLLLSDFGIATIAHSTSSMATSAPVGTLAYMAPEQIQGKPRKESDQYALAVTVYHWLSGRLPFEGSSAEIIVQHLGAPPPPLQEIRPDLPGAVEQVVLTALAKDPSRRFNSVQAFANAFGQASGKIAPPVVIQPQIPAQSPLPPASGPQPVGGSSVMQTPVPPLMRTVAFRQGSIFGLPLAVFNLVYSLFIYPIHVFPLQLQWVQLQWISWNLPNRSLYLQIINGVIVLVCCIPFFFAGRSAVRQTGKMQTGVHTCLWMLLWLTLVALGLETFGIVTREWPTGISSSILVLQIPFFLTYDMIFFLMTSALELGSGTLGAWFGRRLTQKRQILSAQPLLPCQRSSAPDATMQQANSAVVVPSSQPSHACQLNSH